MIKRIYLNKSFNLLSLLIIIVFINSLEAGLIKSIKVSNGITVSKINHTLSYDWKIFEESFTGFSTGLEANFYENSFMSINSKLSYFEIGGTSVNYATDEYNNVIDEFEMIEVFNYISLNSTIKIKYNSDNIEPYISIGPRIDYLFDATWYNNDFNKFNYGFDFGFGFDKKVSEKLNLCVDFTWNKQINKIHDVNPDWVIEPEYSYSIALGIEYILK